MPRIEFVLVGVAVAGHLLLSMRISAFRVDLRSRGWTGAFGPPLTRVSEALSPESYTEEGQRLFWAYRLSVFAVPLSAIIALLATAVREAIR